MMTVTEHLAHGASARLPASDLALSLQQALGQRLVAVIAGVRDPKAVGEWAHGTRRPHPASEQRLRQAYQVTQFLLEAEAPDTVRAWFMGMDPYLDDQAPALVLRDDPAAVLRAARAFRAGG
jgi:hypothetical protein